MPEVISIQVEGQERVDKKLRGYARAVEDLSPAWRPVSDEVYAITQAQFRSEGARAGRRWPKRSEKYLDRLTSLNRRGFATIAEPLRRTGTLYSAVTSRGAPHGIYLPTPNSLTLGFDLKYGRIHQTGGSKMPQRRIYDFTRQDLERILSILARGIVKQADDRGFDFGERPELAF